ncbi:MAG TPA: hypothetical protein VLI06_14130 [Solimonas sp.]|nr:hypothetical protein [Solimonas sp.]
MKELSIDATVAKTKFGKMKEVAEKTVVAVTKRGAVSFYLVSPKRYHAMKGRMGIETSELQKLTDEYNRMASAMQTPQHAAAVDRLMSISEADLRATLDAEYDRTPPPAKLESRRQKPGVRLVKVSKNDSTPKKAPYLRSVTRKTPSDKVKVAAKNKVK